MFNARTARSKEEMLHFLNYHEKFLGQGCVDNYLSTHSYYCTFSKHYQPKVEVRPFKIDCMFCIRIFQKSYVRVRKQNTQHEKLHRISMV